MALFAYDDDRWLGDSVCKPTKRAIEEAEGEVWVTTTPPRCSSSSSDDEEPQLVPTSSAPTIEQKLRAVKWMAEQQMRQYKQAEKRQHEAEQAIRERQVVRANTRMLDKAREQFAAKQRQAQQQQRLRQQQQQHHQQQEQEQQQQQQNNDSSTALKSASNHPTQAQKQAQYKERQRQHHAQQRQQRLYEQQEQQRIVKAAKAARQAEAAMVDAEGMQRISRQHGVSMRGGASLIHLGDIGLHLGEGLADKREWEYAAALKQRQHQARRDRLLQQLEQQQQQQQREEGPGAPNWMPAWVAAKLERRRERQMQQQVEHQIALEDAFLAATAECNSSIGSGSGSGKKKRKKKRSNWTPPVSVNDCYSAPTGPLRNIKEGDEAAYIKKWEAVWALDAQVQAVQRRLTKSQLQHNTKTTATGASSLVKPHRSGGGSGGGASGSSSGGSENGGKVEGLLSRSRRRLVQMLTRSMSDRSLNGRARVASNAA